MWLTASSSTWAVTKNNPRRVADVLVLGVVMPRPFYGCFKRTLEVGIVVVLDKRLCTIEEKRVSKYKKMPMRHLFT